MEHLLNSAWLVAVASLVLLIRRQGHRMSRGYLLGLGAVLCMAMLLFPVISASDDLHPGFDLSDDAAWRHEKRSPGVVMLIALMLFCAVAHRHPGGSIFRVMVEDLAVAVPGSLRLDLGRAPPRIF